MDRRLTATLVIIGLLGAAACGEGGQQADDHPPTEVPATSRPAAPTDPTAPSPDPTIAPGSPADAAVADLAGRLGLATDEITVVRADPVTWPDGSIGCPEPGMMYTQALVPGWLIVLRAQGADYEYHAADTGPPALCPAERATPPVADPRT